jgi:hypothetical protein
LKKCAAEPRMTRRISRERRREVGASKVAGWRPQR